MTRQNRSAEELAMRGLVAAMLRKRWPSARIIHEFPLRYSVSRIDMAAVTPGEIIAVEIKSSRDVMDRLETQLRAFRPVAAHLIVALAPRWNNQLPPIVQDMVINGVKRGTKYVPQFTETQRVIHGIAGCEVWTACHETGAIEQTESGYKLRYPWVSEMLGILHVGELAGIARRHGFDVGRRPTHDDLLLACHAGLPGGVAIREACRALRARAAFDRASDPPIVEPLIGGSA